MAVALLVLACILSFIGGLMLLVAAFRESVLWGLAVLFIPFASVIFLFTHWERAKSPFLVSVAGAGLLMGAVFMGGLTAGTPDEEGQAPDTTAAEETEDSSVYEPSDFTPEELAQAHADANAPPRDSYQEQSSQPELVGNTRYVSRAENTAEGAEDSGSQRWTPADQ